MNICLSCEGVTAAATPRCGHCGAFLLPLESVHYPTRRGEADAGNPLLGSIVDGKYRLDGVLGRGGLGTVFQAEHTGSLMKVAVKLLHPRFSERAEYRKALLPEARRAATVTNERCARLLDVGDTADGGTYLAMELVDGDTLDTLVANGPLAPAHAVDILVQIAEALVAIHAAGLVHCDLAPRNVMVSTRGGALVAKVLDFGIARSISITSGDRREHGEFAGFANAAFSAPEQLAGRDVDPRADLYSLGALGWFLLTGKAPIDDRDAARAARAAIAGELESWPGVPGAPRRLQRLIAACLRLDPEARPPSAAAVRRELLAIRGARRPALARTAVTMLALAVVFAVAAFVETATPFLRSVGGSPLLLRERPQQQPRHLTSRELATLQLRFGGFRVDQLRLDVARAGSLLWQKALHPAVGGGGDMLTLSVAQPEWQQVVRSLVEASREDAVDLSFVVPGRAPLGSARVRVDDDAPQLEAAFADPTATTLTAAAILDWRATDAVGITRLAAFVTLEGGGDFEFDLIGSGGSFSLGRRLAERVETVSTLRGGEVRLEATDFAGNVAQLEVARFAACDVHAPSVRAVTGPAGEPFLPSVGGKLRLRIELSSPERGCELAIRDLDDRERLRRPLDGGAFQDFEIATTDLPSASGQYVFAVTDAAGNVAVAKHACPIRDRAIRLQFVGDAPSCVTVGDELVIGSGGAELALRCSEAYDVTRLGVLPGRAGAAPAAAEVRGAANGRALVVFPPMPPGSYELEVDLEEHGVAAAPSVREKLRLRVLPAAIELRIAKAQSRFLPGVERAGVLQRVGDGYREGQGWALDRELARYVRGTLFVGYGAETLVPTPLPSPSGPAVPFLPEIVPLPGYNLLAVALTDVLGRDVRVLVGDSPPGQRTFEGRTVDVVAEFYWHDQPPEPIGEELLVEYGQPARLRLRLPLPYVESDRPDLRLGLSESEVVASRVESDGDGAAIATFELPFEVWRAAARLRDEPREAFAAQLARSVDVSVRTPVGRYDLALAFRTVRSTLRPITLSEIGEASVGVLPAALAGIRLVPVLAPAGPFVEPVPSTAPPRALFRPQVAVAVRNLPDLLLQDHELTIAEAAAIVQIGTARAGAIAPARLVHADDPLGPGRLEAENLLPGDIAVRGPRAGELPATGLDFFQAYTCCRLLGVALAGDPELFRLPMGCELELAAFGEGRARACNGPAAAGRPLAMAAFLAAAEKLAHGEVASVAATVAAGDLGIGGLAPIAGLDFGVREWVGDLPHIDRNELLLKEWIADHEGHLARVAGFASGQLAPPADLADRLRTVGVVRGLALGEVEGLLQPSGQRLDPGVSAVVPASVPGVLRTEQLRRDGRDFLSRGADARLARVGFRVAGTAALIARIRGLR